MKNEQGMKYIQLYLSGLLLLATLSCSEELQTINNNRLADDERSVMLKLALPGIAAPNMGTRAVGQEQEVAIETLDILAFKVENGVETFLYHSLATKSAGNTGNSSLQTYNATIFVKSFQQRFVIIANARTKIQTLIGSRIDGWVGQEKEGMLSKLTVDLYVGDRWNAMKPSHYTAIPMWGETAPKMIDQNTNTISETTIPLMRMLAKIEVQLDQSVQGLTDIFKLKSVHLYNTLTSGRIVPKPGAEYVGTDIIARKASLPAAVTSVVGPLAYYDFSAPGSLNVAMKGAIYLFERAAKNAGNFLEETCIVVGGFYGTDSQESYYRLDFFAPDGTTHLDILRNNRYICNIVSVKGRGYPTVDDAYRAKSFNLEADILVWNEGVIRDVVFDEQYMLGVSHERFDFDENAHNNTHTDNILKVITNYPNGWTATVWANKAGTTPVPNDAVSGQPWLSITPTSGTGNTQPDLMHILVAANGTDFERTAYIHITAGRLTYMVTVVQAVSDSIFTVTPHTIWISPSVVGSSKSVLLHSTGEWTLVQPNNAIVSPSSGGAGNTTVAVTVPPSSDPKNANHGLSSFTATHTATGRTVNVVVDRLWIDPNEKLMINNNPGPALNTVSYHIDVEGGSETFMVVGVDDPWLTAYKDPTTGELVLEAGQSSNQNNRSTYVTLAHTTDPTYTVKYEVMQDLYTDIPPFKFFVVKFKWEVNDVDIAVEFRDNFTVDAKGDPTTTHVLFDNTDYPHINNSNRSRAMGYGLATHVNLLGVRGAMNANGDNSPLGNAAAVAPLFSEQFLKDGLMFWGGDARAAQGETVFFNAPQITPPSSKEDNTNLPRYIKLDLYAVWYTSNSNPNIPIEVSISTYEDGKMLKPTSTYGTTPPTGKPSINQFNFYNVDAATTLEDITSGGTSAWDYLNNPSWTTTRKNLVRVMSSSEAAINFRTVYTHVATVTYDRYRRSATIDWFATEYTGSAPTP